MNRRLLAVRAWELDCADKGVPCGIGSLLEDPQVAPEEAAPSQALGTLYSVSLPSPLRPS